MSAYRFTHKSVKIKSHDFDLDLILPDGNSIQLQFRPEGDSLDVVFDRKAVAVCWRGCEMTPANPPRGGRAHERLVDQVCFMLPKGSLRKGAKKA